MAKNRILIVEDDKYIAENVGINLDMSGYDYTIINDGLPIWNFYVYESYNGAGQGVENIWPLMTINGIDESVTNIQNGY